MKNIIKNILNNELNKLNENTSDYIKWKRKNVTLNDAEILKQRLINNFCKENNTDYSYKYFEDNTSMDIEMINIGYDGLIIKGREMVNYQPENIKNLKTENELQNYYQSVN